MRSFSACTMTPQKTGGDAGGSRGAELGDERSSEGLGEGSGEEKDSGEDRCELGLQINGIWVLEQPGGGVGHRVQRQGGLGRHQRLVAAVAAQWGCILELMMNKRDRCVRGREKTKGRGREGRGAEVLIFSGVPIAGIGRTTRQGTCWSSGGGVVVDAAGGVLDRGAGRGTGR